MYAVNVLFIKKHKAGQYSLPLSHSFSRGFYTNPASKMIVNEFCVFLNITCIAFNAPLNVENTEKDVQFCSAKSM